MEHSGARHDNYQTRQPGTARVSKRLKPYYKIYIKCFSRDTALRIVEHSVKMATVEGMEVAKDHEEAVFEMTLIWTPMRTILSRAPGEIITDIHFGVMDVQETIFEEMNIHHRDRGPAQEKIHLNEVSPAIVVIKVTRVIKSKGIKIVQIMNRINRIKLLLLDPRE